MYRLDLRFPAVFGGDVEVLRDDCVLAMNWDWFFGRELVCNIGFG